MWSLKHKRCLRCGTINVKHVARGLCVSCYNKFLHRRHRGNRTTRGLASKKLTKEYLVSEYIGKKKSLRDIAKECNCTFQYVYKILIQFDVPLRNKTSARLLALDRGKIKRTRIDDESQAHKVILKKTLVNESFFSIWSPKMAYVLGMIYTDGNIFPSGKRDPSKKKALLVDRLSVAQKETELLIKILAMMNSDAKIVHRRDGIQVLAQATVVTEPETTKTSLHGPEFSKTWKTTKKGLPLP
jgi:hypothetical protein